MPYVFNPITGELDFTNAAGATLPIAESDVTGLTADLALKAPLASPALTGTPTVPTAAVDTNTTQAASTAMVLAQAASTTPIVDGVGTVGTVTRFARGDHIHPTDTSRAPTASPTFTGTVTLPTPSANDNSTKGATTAYVDGGQTTVLSVYEQLAYGALYTWPASTTATNLLLAPTRVNSSGTAVPAAINANGTPIYLDPARYPTVSGRTKTIAATVTCITNAVAPAKNLTMGLVAVSTWGGASGIAPTVASIGSSLVSATVTAPAAGGPATPVTGTATYPAAGFYCFYVTSSGSSAIGAITACQIDLFVYYA